MEPIVLRRGTWHHRLATVYASHGSYYYRDICEYTRGVIKGTLVALLIAALASVLIYPWVDLVIAIFTAGWRSFVDGQFWIAILVAEIALVLFVVIGCGFQWLWERHQDRVSVRPPSAARLMYRSRRDKWCAPVDIV